MGFRDDYQRARTIMELAKDGETLIRLEQIVSQLDTIAGEYADAGEFFTAQAFREIAADLRADDVWHRIVRNPGETANV